MKKHMIAVPLLIFMMLLAFVSCNIGQKGVSKEQFEQDIVGKENIQNLLYSNFTKESDYTIEKYEITKEQLNIEKKEDIIYSDMTVKNDYFKVDLSVRCVFNYYDKGGWVMDEFSIEDRGEVIPVAMPDIEMSFEFIKERMLFNTDNEEDGPEFTWNYKGKEYTYYIWNGELTCADEFIIVDDRNVKLPLKYKTDILELNGYCMFELTSVGWNCKIPYDTPDGNLVVLIEDYKADYSKAIGEFISGSFFNEDVLIIKSIDGTSIQYDYIVSMHNLDIKQNLIDKTAKFDELNGEFILDIYGGVYIAYSKRGGDCWVSSRSGRYCIFERNQ